MKAEDYYEFGLDESPRPPAKSRGWSLRDKLSVPVWLTIACFLCWWFLTGQSTRDLNIYEYEIPEAAEWITTADDTQYTACLRKDFHLPYGVKHAYVRIAAEGGFELLINGSPIGAQTLWRATRHYQCGLTEAGQRFSAAEPITVYNFPREYQWSTHTNEQAVIHLDLTPYLKRGHNVIALELEGRSTQPAGVAFGEVLLKNGSRVAFQTDETWAGEPVPKGVRQPDWMTPTESVVSWDRAVVKKKWRRILKSPVPHGVFSEFQAGHWLLANNKDGMTGQTYTSTFTVDQASDLAYLKILTKGNHWVWVNGERLSGNRAKRKGFNGGEWLVEWEGRRPLATLPVLLDPDETSGFFGGDRYKNPSQSDPTVNDFRQYKNTLNRTSERPKQIQENLLDDRRQPGDPERSKIDPYGFYEEPNVQVPLTILRRHTSTQFHGYDIGEVIRRGENTIRVRLVDDNAGRTDVYGGSQPNQFVILGKAGNQDLNKLEWQNEATGRIAITGKELTPERSPLKFKGAASHRRPLGSIICLALLFLPFYLYRGRLGHIRNAAIVISLTLGMAWLLQFSFQERSEAVFTASPLWRFLCLGTALLLGILQAVRPALKLQKYSVRRGYAVLVVLLLLTFLLRGWNAQHQPIDDDEYASIQAVLSIADTGLPKIGNGDIWYSRSPAYHYLAAAVVKVFGPNIWALRLYSVVLSVLTGWLLWHMARTYFKNTWVAHASLVIFAFHPFLIFTGHIARFYQQQQLCILLMVHLFVLGFLHAPTQWRRNGAIMLFCLAVLSQEISISFVPVFIILYLIFGKGVPFKWERRSILFIALAGLLIVADVALFQVKCITRTVGVSPNVEATLAPTFWELGNLSSMFIMYSRLHLVLSVFYVMSLIYSVRRRSSLLITLHACLVMSIVSFNFIISSVSFRYMYALVPLWILLGAHGMKVFGQWVTTQLDRRNRTKRTVSVLQWVALAVVLMSFSIWRIPGSYNDKILGDSNSCLAYVRENLRPEDKVMITEPHPHAAKIELGRVDYDLVVPILYDFTYSDLESGGVLRDRNGNAIVVNRLAQLQQIFTEEDRVWVIVNREKFRSRKKNIRWEYPGAREELFLRQNCDLKYRSYLWCVYLWDKNSGGYSNFRRESNNWVE